jgi:hypothetical protein
MDSVHVGDVGLLTAPDRAILDYAANALVIVSADNGLFCAAWPAVVLRTCWSQAVSPPVVGGYVAGRSIEEARIRSSVGSSQSGPIHPPDHGL